MGELLKSIECYDLAIMVNSWCAEAYLNKGKSLFAMKKYKESIECYDFAIMIDSRCAEVYLNKGKSLSAIGEYK